MRVLPCLLPPRPFQVVSKFLSMDLVLRDQAISELFAENKLARKAAYGAAIALFAQLEDLLGPGLGRRGRVPDGVLLRPLRFGEQYVRLAAGDLVVANRTEGTATRVFPPGYDPTGHTFINHTVDRGSIGTAVLAVCSGGLGRLLWNVHWGVFHDGWNAVKKAAKDVADGVLWKQVVRFSSISNLNFGPFRSGAWGSEKQEALTNLVDRRGPECLPQCRAVWCVRVLHARRVRLRFQRPRSAFQLCVVREPAPVPRNSACECRSFAFAPASCASGASCRAPRPPLGFSFRLSPCV